MLSTLFKNPSLALVFLCHAMLLYRLTVPSPHHEQFAFFFKLCCVYNNLREMSNIDKFPRS